MKFIIHRGTKEIGGSCVEIFTGKSRIVIDIGLPLVNPDMSKFDSDIMKNHSIKDLINLGILPDIKSLYKPDGKTVLLISHAHQDHYGLWDYIHPVCPVYLGKPTHKLIELTGIFTNRNLTISNLNYFESGKSFPVGDIEITPYLMCHSAFDAYAFLIKANGKSLFYSGDFRTHGRKTKAFDWFCNNVEKNVDYLLLEGTSIGNSGKSFKTESEIEREFVKTFKETEGIVLIYTSGQNIDRLVSIYRACKKTGRIFVIDFYVATVLFEIASFGFKIPYPSPAFPEIKVFYPWVLSRTIYDQGFKNILFRFKDFKIKRNEINSIHKNIVMIIRPGMRHDLGRIRNLQGGLFVYSLWSGYKRDKYTMGFIEFVLNQGMSEKEIHTSGHADLTGLKKMIDAIKPKNIVPIHTFEKDKYKDIFIDSNVLFLNDKEIVSM